ncbi:tryptophan synthase subunit alpha [Psychrobacillus glaciei]|uniref:Tryptophan synthase alpha chain n=1 Tax=Psychrobacillus glaciei TaxID=2283160 RepID=A0A5J6SNM2_9BACI|nr:tryptophan synthase subunit alpha [Psychrobacillus glaciei]QFF99043.1 tryptophan synthase subunit alpha [Psychrobacillus glaciei]
MEKKRLTDAIVASNHKGEKAFIPYIMAGDGGIETLKTKLLFLQKAGVTAIEVGIPFSDPVADGKTIQQAGERAISKGTTLRLIMKEIETFYKQITVPLVLMTYYNPLLSYGIDLFAADCVRIGIGGIIVPDLPLEESDILRNALVGTDVALVPLVSLTSPPDRIAKITAVAEGFIYAVTVNGITGIRNAFDKTLEQHLANLKEQSTIPVLAGFGISTPEQVESMVAIADGVIVGSAIVEAFHHQDINTIQTLIQASNKNVFN